MVLSTDHSPSSPASESADPSPQGSGALALLKRLEGVAENELKDMASNVEQLCHSHTMEQAASIASKVVTGVGHVLDYVGVIAVLHPAAEVVVSAVKKVIQLEKQRHENHAQIAEVHGSMISTVYHLKVLLPITEAEDELKVHLQHTYQHMETTIKEFGQFVDLYHKCWQKIFKVLMAHHHKKRLTEFNGRFDKHRLELDRVISTRTTAMTLQRLDLVYDNTQRIIQHFPIIDHELAAAEHFVEKNGGADAVIQNEELLNKLAKQLDEQVTDSMKATLQEDFDSLLAKHAERYELKLRSLENNVITAVNESHAELSRKFDAGPHELIEDEDMQVIWKDNGWKSSVKCRLLVEAMHEYYQKKFLKHSERMNTYHDDAWTVEFFSRMMYHSAIGDIIDEDGSGSITASEMNTFCGPSGRRPAKWSVPQWFAFCASGWYNNNTWYYRCIKNMMKEIDEEFQKYAHKPNEQQKKIKTIVDCLKPLLFVEDLEDVAESNPPHKLHRLQEDYRTQEANKISSNLAKFSYHLEDKTAVAAIMGDTRVELHIMCIFYVCVSQLRHIIPAKLRGHGLRTPAVEDLAMSIMVAFLAFEARMHELMRGWRSQGRDIELQLGRYADGLFENIQRDAPKRKATVEMLCKELFVHENVPPRFRTMIEAASSSPHSRLDELTELVQQLNARMGKLELLLAGHETRTAVVPNTNHPIPTGVASPSQLPFYEEPGKQDASEQQTKARLSVRNRIRNWFANKLESFSKQMKVFE